MIRMAVSGGELRHDGSTIPAKAGAVATLALLTRDSTMEVPWVLTLK
jgi:hypothetical protein